MSASGPRAKRICVQLLCRSDEDVTMLKLRWVAVMAAVWIPAISSAAWTRIAESSTTVYEIDDASVAEVRAGIRSAQTRLTFSEPQASPQGFSYKSLEVGHVYACDKGQLSMQRVTYFDERGAVVQKGGNTGITFTTPAPNTGPAFALARVCSARLEQPSASSLTAALKRFDETQCAATMPTVLGRQGIHVTPSQAAATCSCARSAFDRGEVQAAMARRNTSADLAVNEVMTQCAEPVIRAYHRERLDREQKAMLQQQRHWTDAQYEQYASCMVTTMLQATNNVSESLDRARERSAVEAERCSTRVQ